MQVSIKFKAQGSNSVIGGFSSGDVARVNSDFARHLVEEARVAEYLNEKKPDDKPKRKKAEK